MRSSIWDHPYEIIHILDWIQLCIECYKLECYKLACVRQWVCVCACIKTGKASHEIIRVLYRIPPSLSPLLLCCCCRWRLCICTGVRYHKLRHHCNLRHHCKLRHHCNLRHHCVRRHHCKLRHHCVRMKGRISEVANEGCLGCQKLYRNENEAFSHDRRRRAHTHDRQRDTQRHDRRRSAHLKVHTHKHMHTSRATHAQLKGYPQLKIHSCTAQSAHMHISRHTSFSSPGPDMHTSRAIPLGFRV